MELPILLTEQISTTYTLLDRAEATDLAHELRRLLGAHRLIIAVEVEVERRRNLLRLTHVVELQLLLAEERLEDVGVLILSAHSLPVCRLPTVLRICDIHRIIHQSHLLVRRLVLKDVTVLVTEVHHEVDDLRSGVRDLDRVRLDVSHSEAHLLDLVLEIDHEQSTTL